VFQVETGGSFKIRISKPSREAATWKTGLKGGFGLIAIIDFDSLASTYTASSMVRSSFLRSSMLASAHSRGRFIF
jgi:hypothetical protein